MYVCVCVCSWSPVCGRVLWLRASWFVDVQPGGVGRLADLLRAEEQQLAAELDSLGETPEDRKARLMARADALKRVCLL